MLSKLWFRAGAIAVLSLALSSTIAAAQDHDHGYDKHDRDDDHDRDHEHGNAFGHDHDRGHDRYDDHDRDAARNWYRAHYDHLPRGFAKHDRLPPGLQAQLVVRGTLPLGLQRQMQPCPHELEAMFTPPPPNYAHVVIGGNLVLVNRVKFQIADVVHLDIY